MSVFDSPKDSYSNGLAFGTRGINDVRVISDIINLIDPRDTPLLDALGGLDAARSKFRIRANGTMIEWLEDEYSPLATTVATIAATDTTTVTVADASVFSVGHVALVGSEQMWISAINTTSNVLTVTRAFNGTTGATAATNAAITVVGMARLEGSTTTFDSLVDITAPYNYTSIFQAGLKITGTEMAVDQLGYSDVWTYQANKKMKEMFRLVEKNLFYGGRNAGSATTPRSFGSLSTFITNNSVNAGGGIAKADVDDLMEAIFMDGGSPNVLVINPAVGNDFRTLIDSSSFVRMTQENTSLGMKPITMVDTQYGSLKLIEDRWCPVGTAWGLDTNKIGLYTLRPFGWKPNAHTGDFESADLVGEISLVVANDKAHGYIYGITS
jgi:hypothetical protein